MSHQTRAGITVAIEGKYEEMTVRELGDIAAARGVTAANLLSADGPQHAPSTPVD